jgi:hypothetical protein
VARGESGKSRPLSIGIAIAAVLAVATVCALFSIVNSNRPPQPYTAYGYPTYPTYPSTEPFRGASAAFGTVTSRDSVRSTASGGAALTRDPVAARRSLEAALTDRGYVVGATAETPATTLPFDAPAADLEGACGVVLLVGDAATTITRAGVGSSMFTSVDPSAFTVALCGPATIHVEGVGHAAMRTWLLPGLTPAALTTTALTADALLAHAEAELLLRRHGYAPVDELIEVHISATTPGGFLTLHLPTTPAAGCIPFVAYADGAGRPQLPTGTFDHLDDRALNGAISCATSTRSWEPLYVDDSIPDARVLVRAYATAASVPSTPTITIGGAHTVDAAHATWPTAIAESP